MSAQIDAAAEVATVLFPDDESLFHGLDPVLAAHMSERMEAEPDMRRLFAIAAMGRMLGWADE